jgi:hypothetical protein
LGKGAKDTAANRTWASCEESKFAHKHSVEGKTYGCACKGIRAVAIPELWCTACERFFHVQCERLVLSKRELQSLRECYLCVGCERTALQAAGVDLDAPLLQAAFECRWCAKVFSSERGILIHTARCGAKPEEVVWSCACKGTKSSAKASGAQCALCVNYFHPKCRAELRPTWCQADDEAASANDDGVSASALCEMCARVRREERSGKLDLLGRRAARPIACAQQLVPADGALATLVPTADDSEFGTLGNRRVRIAPSMLPSAGLGLFAAVAFEAGEFITAYSGPLLYKAEVEATKGLDQSYLLRIPGSGGQLIDGRRFADAVRRNDANPLADGSYVPSEGAREWQLGAASMANDPRVSKLYNARLVFKKPKGSHRDLLQLVPMRAYLCATVRISPGDEVFYNYGSDKPFEAVRTADKEADAKAKAKGKLKRAFRVMLIQPEAAAAAPANVDDPARVEAQRESKRRSQSGMRSERAALRTRRALLDSDGFSSGMLAAFMSQNASHASAPACPICSVALQLSVADTHAHIEECLRARKDIDLMQIIS